MFSVKKAYLHFVLVCLLTANPFRAWAGGTPEEAKAFRENKAKAEAGEGFESSNQFVERPIDATGKPAQVPDMTPAAFVANAYLSGIGVERDESEALLWYLKARWQRGINHYGFKALIKSMPGEKLQSIVLRHNQGEPKISRKPTPEPEVFVDQVFIPLARLTNSDVGELEGFDGGFSSFLAKSAFFYGKRDLVVEFNKMADAGAVMTRQIGFLNTSRDKNYFTAKITFTQVLTDSEKAVFDAASAHLERRVKALIDNPSSGDSDDLDLVASAYANGQFGLKADPGQRKRWADLAKEARISEAKIRRAEADSSGPEVWLQVANEWQWNTPEVREIIGERSYWISRYLQIQSLKAEAGDPAALDGLIAYYGAIVRDAKGIRSNSHESSQLIRWISDRHKLSKSPEDAIILAHHYAGLKQMEKANALALEYFVGLRRKAGNGSASDLLRLALLADPNWYEPADASTGYVRNIYSNAEPGEFYSFRDHGMLLKSFAMAGPNVPSSLEEGEASNPFGADFDPNSPGLLNGNAARGYYLKYVESFSKLEAMGGPFRTDFSEYDAFAAVLRGLAEQDQYFADQYSIVKGLPRDYEPALRWHRMLAEMGDAPALSFIAASFEQGRGVPRDPSSAYAYYALAIGWAGYMNHSPFQDTFQKTRGTNEQKLDAYFKLTPAEKVRALKVYNEFVAKLIARMDRLVVKGGEVLVKQDIQQAGDYAAKKAAKAKSSKK